MNDELVVVQTILPSYREPFFEQLGATSRFAVTVVVGDAEAGVSADQRAAYSGISVLSVKTRRLLGERLLWQRGAVPIATRARVAVVELNPRNLSCWLTLLARAVSHRRTLVWGHAWSRSGRESWTNRLRSWLLRVADGLIVYAESDRLAMEAGNPNLSVWTAGNAVFTAAQINPVKVERKETAFVVSGRLISEKKPELAVEALAALDRADARLLFVGEGPERERVEALSRQLGVKDRVEFMGEVFEYDELRSAYERCIASISAGYVGLSMTQSHAFGLPMIFPDNEPHAPEIEAAAIGLNAIEFESNNPQSLASAMNSVIEDRDAWAARRESISDACREAYSIEAMVEGFLAAVNDEPVSR